MCPGVCYKNISGRYSGAAAALRMTVNKFLTEEVRGITPEQAREYLKAFTSSADDSKILTAYYLVRATTDPSKK